MSVDIRTRATRCSSAYLGSTFHCAILPDIADPDTSSLFAVSAAISLAVPAYHTREDSDICADLITVSAAISPTVPTSDNPNVLAFPVWRDHKLPLPDLTAVSAAISPAVPAPDDEEVRKCLPHYDRVLRYRCWHLSVCVLLSAELLIICEIYICWGRRPPPISAA